MGYNAYMTPCVANCSNNLSSGYDQVNAVVNRLNAEINKVSNMFIWVNIDISQPWSKNQNENREFMNEVVLALFVSYLFIQNVSICENRVRGPFPLSTTS